MGHERRHPDALGSSPVHVPPISRLLRDERERRPVDMIAIDEALLDLGKANVPQRADDVVLCQPVRNGRGPPQNAPRSRSVAYLNRYAV